MRGYHSYNKHTGWAGVSRGALAFSLSWYHYTRLELVWRWFPAESPIVVPRNRELFTSPE